MKGIDQSSRYWLQHHLEIVLLNQMDGSNELLFVMLGKVLQTFNIFIKSSRKIHFSASELCPAVSVCPLSRIGHWSRFVLAWVGGTQVSSRSHESSRDEDHNDDENKMTMLRMTMISMWMKRGTQVCSLTSHEFSHNVDDEEERDDDQHRDQDDNERGQMRSSDQRPDQICSFTSHYIFIPWCWWGGEEG